MTRRRAVAILVLVVGGLIAASLSTIVAGTTDEPARFAQVYVGTQKLDVWREVKTHDITFHWDEQIAGKDWVFVPERSELETLSAGQIVSTKRFASNKAAWSAIKGRFGVTWPQVRAALLQGSPSPLPPTG